MLVGKMLVRVIVVVPIESVSTSGWPHLFTVKRATWPLASVTRALTVSGSTGAAGLPLDVLAVGTPTVCQGTNRVRGATVASAQIPVSSATAGSEIESRSQELVL